MSIDIRLTWQYQYCQLLGSGKINLKSEGMDRMKIRLKVKEIAEQKGFNQSTLSRRADVDFKTVQRLFRDPTRDISISTLVKIARALKTDVNDLIEVIPEEDD